jgi:thioredoxin 1
MPISVTTVDLIFTRRYGHSHSLWFLGVGLMSTQVVHDTGMIQLDDSTVSGWLADQTGLSMVFVTAGWCTQSQALAPVVTRFAAAHASVAVAAADFDQSPQFVADAKVTGVPTVLVFKGGEPVDVVCGCAEPSVWEDRLADSVQRAA